MLSIARHTLGARWPSFVGSFLALALGVALFAAAGLALTAAFAGPSEPPRWYVTPDVVVSGPAAAGVSAAEPDGAPGNTALPPGERGYLPAGAAERLATLDGLRHAMVDRAGYAQLGEVTEAHPWAATALHAHALVAGGPPAADDDVVLTAPTARRPGDTVTVITANGPRDFTVSGIVRTEAPPTLYVTGDTAARLANGRIAAVALFASTGTDGGALAEEARAVLGDWPALRVLTGDDRRSAEPDPDADLLVAAGSLLGEMAGMAGFVSALVVAGTFAFTVAQRRREFALLRVAGATPRQVRRLVLGEALLVGVPAGLAGCVLGTVIAPPFALWLARVGLAPGGFTARFSLWPVAAAFGLGLVVSAAGAWAAARRAGAVRPIEALREASVEGRTMTPVRWVLGLAGLAGVVPMTPLVRTPAGSAYLLVVAMLLILGCGLLAPVFVPPLVRLLSVGRGPVTVLARASALAAVGRISSAVLPVLVTVGLAGAGLASVATFSAAEARGARDHVTAPALVTPADATGAAALPGALAAEVRQVPGVTAAVPVKSTFVYDRDDTMVRQRAAWYVDGRAAPHTFRLPVVAGSLTDLAGDTVALSRSVADAHGWTVGDEAGLWLNDGAFVRLRVVAVLDHRLGLPAALLPWSLASAHSTVPLADHIYLGLEPGVDPTVVDGVVRPLGGHVVPTEAYLSTVDAEFDQLSRLALLAILGMSLAYTGISVANTQIMATAGRVRELGTLRLAGATPGQVLRIVGREAALVGAIGAVLGGAVTAATLAVAHAALSPMVSAVPIVVPWPPLLVVTACCGLAAFLAGLAPATVARTREF